MKIAADCRCETNERTSNFYCFFYAPYHLLQHQHQSHCSKLEAPHACSYERTVAYEDSQLTHICASRCTVRYVERQVIVNERHEREGERHRLCLCRLSCLVFEIVGKSGECEAETYRFPVSHCVSVCCVCVNNCPGVKPRPTFNIHMKSERMARVVCVMWK